MREVGLCAFGFLLAVALAAGGVAAIWFPVEAILDFQPQNITVGWPGNPRIPDDEQRTDLILDSLLMIAMGVVLLASAVAITIGLILNLRRPEQR